MKITKKLIAFALCAALTLSLAPAANAAGNVRVTLPKFTVTLGGQIIDPAKEEYPFLVYRDITYLPLTYFGCRLLGLYEKWTPEHGLFISDAGAKGEYESTPRKSSNSGALYAQIATGPIRIRNKSTTKEVENDREEYPFLLFRDITYLPMTWANMHDLLGCEYSFDSKTGLVIDRAQTTNGAALYLPIYRNDEFGETGAIAAWEGWFWYQDNEGWISRTPMAGGEREKLFELPVDDYLPESARVRPSLTVREDGLFMTYHTGGATMGRDWQYLFHADGSCELLTDFCGAFGKFDGYSLLANCNLSPSPNNLLRSYDNFETFEEFGDGHYIYGWSYCESSSAGSASGTRGTGDLIYQVGNYAYLLGTDVSDWGTAQPDANGGYPERFSAVCRVDLASGRTEPVTGPAAKFQIVDNVIWYIDFDGALHRCAIDGADDWQVSLPASTEKHITDPVVRQFCVDGDTVYLIAEETVHRSGGAGTEPGDFPSYTLWTVRPGGEPVWLIGSTELGSFQLDGGYLTVITGEAATRGNTLTVYKNGKKLYELSGPEILAAGVSAGKLYYVLK